MEIPLVIFYFLFLIAVAIFFLFAFFNIYHLVRFGPLNLITTMAILFFLIITGGILLLLNQRMALIDWQQTIQLMPALTF